MKDSVVYKNAGNNKILIRSFKGYTTREEIILSWHEMVDQNMIKPGYIGIISDYTDAQLKIKVDDLKSFIQFFKNHKHVFSGFKIAQVISNQGVVFPIDFEDEEHNFKSRSFLTLEEAKHWILS